MFEALCSDMRFRADFASQLVLASVVGRSSWLCGKCWLGQKMGGKVQMCFWGECWEVAAWPRLVVGPGVFAVWLPCCETLAEPFGPGVMAAGAICCLPSERTAWLLP